MVQYRRHYIGFKKGEIRVLGLKNDYLTVQFSNFGAQLTSIKDADGVEYLWHHDPNFWIGQAPVLFQFTKVLEMIRQFINLQIFLFGYLAQCKCATIVLVILK